MFDTADQILTILGQIREQFDWVLEPERGRYADRRSQARWLIRASIKKGLDKGFVLGPIGAVCYGLTSELVEDEYQAAKTIGLSMAVASDLIAAANDATWRGSAGERQPDAGLTSLRADLMETVGVK